LPGAAPIRQRQTPFGLTTIPPHFFRRSSEAIRRGPRPGWAIAKARIRSSTTAESWLGMRGLRRSRGRSISSPCRSTLAFTQADRPTSHDRFPLRSPHGKLSPRGGF
jgi:hypothetical protein